MSASPELVLPWPSGIRGGCGLWRLSRCIGLPETRGGNPARRAGRHRQPGGHRILVPPGPPGIFDFGTEDAHTAAAPAGHPVDSGIHQRHRPPGPASVNRLPASGRVRDAIRTKFTPPALEQVHPPAPLNARFPDMSRANSSTPRHAARGSPNLGDCPASQNLHTSGIQGHHREDSSCLVMSKPHPARMNIRDPQELRRVRGKLRVVPQEPTFLFLPLRQQTT